MVALTRKLFTIDEYHKMFEVGILQESDRVELIRGEIIKMAAMGVPHIGCLSALSKIFSKRIGENDLLLMQVPIKISENSEPEPDLILLSPRDDNYKKSPIQIQDILLVIEVAVTSIKEDREIKSPLYAEAGIKEYWIVDFNGGLIEVCREPSRAGYKDIKQYRRGEKISSLAFPDIVISVDEILD